MHKTLCSLHSSGFSYEGALGKLDRSAVFYAVIKLICEKRQIKTGFGIEIARNCSFGS